MKSTKSITVIDRQTITSLRVQIQGRLDQLGQELGNALKGAQ